MTKNDLEVFGQLMAVLNECFGDPTRALSDLKLEFYFKVLEDITIEDLQRACLHLARTKTIHTFPTPGEIRQALEGNPEDQARGAWEVLIDAIRTIGGYRSVTFADPKITTIVQLSGGWVEVCNKTSDELKWFEKDFLKIYQSLQRRGYNGETKSLAGIHERTIATQGISYEIQPVLVGITHVTPALMSAGGKR